MGKIAMKYFYTDPLKAAWMKKEHNIKIASSNSINLHIQCGVFTLTMAGEKYHGYQMPLTPLYVPQDCHHIFEPQVGDLASVEAAHERGGKVYTGYIRNVTGMSIMVNGRLVDKSYVTKVEIIQRNGIAFFAPEVEV